MPDIQVKQMDEMKLVGYHVLCEGEEYIEEIPKAALLLDLQKEKIRNIISGEHVGAFMVDALTEKEDGYWIAVRVEKFEDVPDNMDTLTIPAHRYVSIRHNGPNYEIRNTYEKLHLWMNEQGFSRRTNSWSLELYRGEHKTKDMVTADLYESI